MLRNKTGSWEEMRLQRSAQPITDSFTYGESLERVHVQERRVI